MYAVKSTNFEFHATLTADTYQAALALAKKRGFQAQIYASNELVATWCPLYGTKVYNQRLAA